MKFRLATPEDAPAITALIGATGYYPPTDAGQLDGVIIVAESMLGAIHGCVWAMVCGRHAYIDYLCVRPGKSGRMALRLLINLQHALHEMGVQWARGAIKTDNQAAIRVAEAMGATTDPGYSLGFKRI